MPWNGHAPVMTMPVRLPACVVGELADAGLFEHTADGSYGVELLLMISLEATQRRVKIESRLEIIPAGEIPGRRRSEQSYRRW